MPMEESVGAQYAIQIAVHTLRDRCKTLQQRISLLEDENIILRTKCIRNEETEHSLSELDKARYQIAEVTEQRDQMNERLKMVTTENQDLWTKLGKLIRVNKNLNEQFSKINETLNQHTSPPALIRSKTFTQNKPLVKHSQKNIELNENLSLELENISLKLMDSFSKQKIEIEKMCSEISEMQCDDDIITENFGFSFDDELEDEVNEELNYVLEDLKTLRDEVLAQRNALNKNLSHLEYLTTLKTAACQICDKRKTSKEEKSTCTDIPRLVDKSTETLQYPPIEDKSHHSQSLPVEVEKICPICSKHFNKHVSFEEFQQHVEDHFIPEIVLSENISRNPVAVLQSTPSFLD